MQFLNRPFLGDDRRQVYHTRNARRLRQLRIEWRSLLENHGALDVATHLNTNRGCVLLHRRRRRRRRRRCRDATDNATEYAAHGPAAHAASHAADYSANAGGGWRKLIFSNGGDFPGDGLGSHEPAGIELPGNHFDHFDCRRCRRRRRRWRRRRRSHQETLQRGGREHFSVDQRQDHSHGDQYDLPGEGNHHCPALVGLAHAVYERLFKHTSFLSLLPRRLSAGNSLGPPRTLLHRTALVGLLRTVSTRGVAGPPPTGVFRRLSA